MTPEEKELLEKIARQVDENNEILKGVRRHQRWTVITRVAYWVLILLLSFGAFYFIQPYLGFLSGDISQIEQFKDIWPGSEQ